MLRYYSYNVSRWMLGDTTEEGLNIFDSLKKYSN